MKEIHVEAGKRGIFHAASVPENIWSEIRMF